MGHSPRLLGENTTRTMIMRLIAERLMSILRECEIHCRNAASISRNARRHALRALRVAPPRDIRSIVNDKRFYRRELREISMMRYTVPRAAFYHIARASLSASAGAIMPCYNTMMINIGDFVSR